MTQTSDAAARLDRRSRTPQASMARDRQTRSGDGPPRPVSGRGAALVVAACLGAGLFLAALLCLLVFPGAVEAVITGAALIGLGAGWALLAGLAARTGQPQVWARIPAVLMVTTGVLMVVTAPGQVALSTLGWVWPLVLAATAVFCTTRMRRDLRGSGRWLLYPVFASMLAASAGGLYLQVSQVGDEVPAPGHLYTVDGHRMHLDCRGTGGPTVVTEAGLGEMSASFARIAPVVAQSTRTCTFDRAGQGWSEDSSQPKDGLQAARDLHSALAAAGEEGPYVMVGHSTGGTYVMVYAAEYPEDVAGMVLLDSSSPRQLTLIPSFEGEYRISRRLVALLPSLSRLGVGRLVPASAISDLPQPAAEQVRAIYVSPRGLRNQRDEQAAIPELFRQAQALTTLDDKPLAVVTATVDASDGWGDAQDRLASLSTSSTHLRVAVDHGGILYVATGSAVSVRAITEVVAAVRGR
jgi:pimeloyl-ACP methyl ester carboxylesterase